MPKSYPRPNPSSETSPEFDMQYASNQQYMNSKPGFANVDELARVFNTALVATRTESSRDFSAEIFSLVETPAFQAVLGSIRQLARTQGISEREAAEILIQTFRKLDRLWSDYIFQEGLDRLKSQLGSN